MFTPSPVAGGSGSAQDPLINEIVSFLDSGACDASCPVVDAAVSAGADDAVFVLVSEFFVELQPITTKIKAAIIELFIHFCMFSPPKMIPSHQPNSGSPEPGLDVRQTVSL
jgi:hypothetical protein